MNSFAHPIKIIIQGNVHVYGAYPGEAVPPACEDIELLGEITRQKAEVTFNTNRTYKSGKKAPDGIEIRFGTARPTEATREELKAHGFQFSERQTLWYAVDNAKSRELAERWANEEVEVDTTQYIKQHFWARVRSHREYNQLRNYTEFFLKTEPPKNFYSKSYLEKAVKVDDVIAGGLLYFKKYFNRPADEIEEDEPGSSGNNDSTAIADRLQELADRMQKDIDSKINSATSQQRPTARRRRIAAGMREEGYQLQDIQRVLYALAEAHRNGTIEEFPYLANIRNKSQVELLNRYGRFIKENWPQTYIEGQLKSNRELLEKLGITSLQEWQAADEQKNDLLNDSSTAQRHTEQQRRMKELEDKIWKMNIPGFFPTPLPLIERMLELADLKEDDAILEPSAGMGNILDAIRDFFGDHEPDLDAVEINAALREILELKGYNLVKDNFLEMESPAYDKIIMNPPFENGQDIDHVTHAYSLLKFGGRVVAIVSEGVFFRPFKKEVVFRKFLQDKNAYVSEPIKNAFKSSFNPTGVNVRIIAVNDDGSSIPNQTSVLPAVPEDLPSHHDEAELLELEAEAELELLKMRVELERRRKRGSIDGIPSIDEEKLQRFRQKAWALQDNIEIQDFH